MEPVEKNSFSRFIHLLPEVALILDGEEESEGAILDANERAAELLGYSRQKLIGMYIHDIDTDPDSIFKDLNSEEIFPEKNCLSRERAYQSSHKEIYTLDIRSNVVEQDGKRRFLILGRNISRKKEDEKHLRVSARKYQAALDSIPEAIHVVTQDMKMVLVNKELEEWIGNSGSFMEINGKTVEEIFSGNGEFYQDYEKVFQGAGPVTKIEEVSIDGKKRLIESKKIPIKKKNKVKQVLTVMRDISRQKEMESTLKSHLAFLETFLNTIPSPVFYKDLEGVYRGCNRVFANQVLGKEPEEVIGRKLSDFAPQIPLKKAIFFTERDRNLIEKPGVQKYETSLKCADGKERDFVFYKSTFLNEKEEISGIVGVMLDITERKRVEKELKENQQRLTSLMKNLPGMVYQCRDDVQCTMTFSSEGCYELTGYNPGELIYRTKVSFFDLIHSEERDVIHKIRKDSLKKNTSYEFTYRIYDKEGNEKWVWDKGRGIYNVNGKPVAIEGIIIDITQQKMAQRALEESELKYRKLVETANDAIIIANADTGIIMDANSSAVRLTGRAIYELIGLHYKELHPPAERKKAAENFRKHTQEKGFMICNLNILRKDGAVIPVEISASFASLRNQSIVQGIIRDVRPQKEIEKQLKRSVHEKEVLLKEVHHRVKNNLQVIYGLLLLQSHSIKDEKALQVLKDSQNRIQSMALIHRNLYQKTGDMGHVNFKEYGENLVHDVFTSYGVNPEKIGYETDIREILLDIDRAIPCGLIVNELVSNVLKYAFPGSMTGRISVSFQAVKEDYILKVEDNGKGMPDVEDHNESCLGLELVNMLTQQLKGELEIQTEKGTSVRITFPQKR